MAWFPHGTLLNLLKTKTGGRVAAALVLATSPAAADWPMVGSLSDEAAPSRAAPAPPSTRRRWYGWQTLVIDASAIATASAVAVLEPGGTAANGTGATVLFAMSGATYLFGGPIVHWAHRNVGKGFGSLALRTFGPLGLAGLGCLAAGGPLGSGSGHGAACYVLGIGGAAVGAVTAITVDAAALAYDDAPRTPSAFQRLPQHAFAPTASVGPGWIAIGAAGSF